MKTRRGFIGTLIGGAAAVVAGLGRIRYTVEEIQPTVEKLPDGTVVFSRFNPAEYRGEFKWVNLGEQGKLFKATVPTGIRRRRRKGRESVC